MDKKLKTFITVMVMGSCWSIVYLIPFIQYVFYDPLKEALGASNTQLGFLLTIYGLGNIYGCPIGGWIADRFNYKKVYMGSVLLNGILGLIFIMNPTYSFALIMWVGFSISGLVMNYPAHIKIIRNLVGDKDQGKIFGFNETAVGIGNIIFNAIMMLLFTHFLEGVAGLKAAIAGLSIMSILLTFAAYYVIDDPTKIKPTLDAHKEAGDKMDFQAYMALLKSPATWLLAISIFSVYSFLTTMTYFTPYFTDVLGATVAFSGVVAIIRTYVMTLMGAPIGGYLTDKVKSPSKVLLVSNLLGAVCLIALLNMGKGTPVSMLIALTLFMAMLVYVGRGSYYAVITELKVPKNRTASTIGVAAAIGFSPDVFQFLLFGTWLDKYGQMGYTYMFLYQLVVLVIGALAAITVLRIKKNIKEPNEDTLMESIKAEA